MEDKKMKVMTEEIKNEIRKMVYEFFAGECDVDISELTDETNILDDLDGDSLMFLELVEQMKKKYSLQIQMQTLGKYILKHPVETLGKIVEVSYLIYEKENEIVSE